LPWFALLRRAFRRRFFVFLLIRGWRLPDR
jgi:hypothetical protein